MVNGWLKLPIVRDRPIWAAKPRGFQIGVFADRLERNFATNAALTSEITGIARSRFGPADSWVIKTAGAAAFAVER
jgi:hypothetical protein